MQTAVGTLGAEAVVRSFELGIFMLRQRTDSEVGRQGDIHLIRVLIWEFKINGLHARIVREYASLLSGEQPGREERALTRGLPLSDDAILVLRKCKEMFLTGTHVFQYEDTKARVLGDAEIRSAARPSNKRLRPSPG